MQVSVEQLSATRRRLDVELPSEDVASELDRAYGRLQQQAQIKGFRPGKVPRRVLEKMYGDGVRADVLSHMIEHSYSRALVEAGLQLQVVSAPEIVPQSVEIGQPLRYSATVDVQPEIELAEWRGLSVKRPAKPVTDEDVDQAIEQLRESMAEMHPVEDRDVVEQGDFLTIDFQLVKDGEPMPERVGENRLVEVGAGRLPPEVDAALVGAKVGETLSPEVTFPDDAGDPEIAGATVVFEVTPKGIREKVLPAADDDLAAAHGEVETFAELRDAFRERLVSSRRQAADDAVRQQVLTGLAERNPFEVPGSLIDRQLEGLLEQFLSRFGPEAARLKEDTEAFDRMRSEMRPRAEEQVRSVLALEALAKQEGIEVGDEDVQAEIDRQAERAGGEAKRLHAAYADPSVREDLRARMVRERALEQLVEAASIEDVESLEVVEED